MRIKLGIINNNIQAREKVKNMLLQAQTGKNVDYFIQVLFDCDCTEIYFCQNNHQPDIILLDLERSENRMIEKIKLHFPQSEILVLSDSLDLKTIRRCFREGAVSYLLKSTCAQHIHFAILVTYNKESFVSPKVCRVLIDQTFMSKRYEEQLSIRERQIANGLVEGLSYKMIADQYSISLDTVRVYIKRVYRKLNINSKGELITQLSL